MLGEEPRKWEVPSGGTKFSSRHDKLFPPSESFTDLSQDMDFQAEGVAPYRWMTWHTLGTERTERCTAKASMGSSTTG